MGWEEFKTGAVRYFTVLGVIVAIILLVAAYSLRGKVASKFYEYRAGRQVVGIWEGERDSRTLEHIPKIRARWEFDEDTFILTTDYFFAEANEWWRVHEMRGDYEFIKRGGLNPSQLAISNVTVRRSDKETSVGDPIDLRRALRLDPIDETEDAWGPPRIDYPDLTVRFSQDSDVLTIGTNLMGVANYDKVE